MAKVDDNDEQRFLVLYLRIYGLRDGPTVSVSKSKHSN